MSKFLNSGKKNFDKSEKSWKKHYNPKDIRIWYDNSQWRLRNRLFSLENLILGVAISGKASTLARENDEKGQNLAD